MGANRWVDRVGESCRLDVVGNGVVARETELEDLAKIERYVASKRKLEIDCVFGKDPGMSVLFIGLVVHEMLGHRLVVVERRDNLSDVNLTSGSFDRSPLGQMLVTPDLVGG